MLGSSALTAAAALGVTRYQHRLQGMSASNDELVQAVEEVLSASQAITLRAQFWRDLANAHAKPAMAISVLLKSQKPLDFPSLFESMFADQDRLTRASSRLWIAKDQRTVALANDVVVAAADVLSAVTGAGEQTGRQDGESISDAVATLAASRKALAEHARVVLKHRPIDLWAQGEPPS